MCCDPISIVIMDAAMCLLLAFMLISASSVFEINMLITVVIMFNILELIVELLPNYPTIQKPNSRQFPELSMTALADALKPNKFTGVHFKRWSTKAMVWFVALKINW